MKETNEETHTRPDQDEIQRSSPDPEIHRETSSRRELIERYGKYAIIGAPLLVFVSQARANKSRP